MKINLKRFVDINIKKRVSESINGTRETCVLFTPEGTFGQDIEVESYIELESKTASWATRNATLAHGKVYFDNGGVKIKIIEGISYDEIVTESVDHISDLDDKYICIAYASSDTDRIYAYNELKTIAKNRQDNSKIYGVNEKIIISEIKPSDIISTDPNIIAYNDNSKIKNFAAKLSSIQGAGMTIAAYLSQINVYEVDSVYDYNFTLEQLQEESIDDTVFGNSIDNHFNVNVLLARESTNCGGDCKDGNDLTNNFVRIVLHQTITERLISLLTQKIKSIDGLSKIYTTIAQELNNYLNNGYLTTDKIWTDSDLVITYNNQQFDIIEKGTALTSGYIIKILPFTSLSDPDKAAHKAPPIYIVLADQYGIRKITINGEII